MKKVFVLVLISAIMVALTGCNTIASSNMSYLGNDDARPNVTGRGTHISYAGIGVNGQSYVNVYERARSQAMSEGSRRFSGEHYGDVEPMLYNVKVFQEYRSWPQRVGISLIASGFLFGFAMDSPQTAVLLTLAGSALFPLEIYDLWLVSDYGVPPEARR